MIGLPLGPPSGRVSRPASVASLPLGQPSGCVNRRKKSYAIHLFGTDQLIVAASGSVVQALMHMLACDDAHESD